MLEEFPSRIRSATTAGQLQVQQFKRGLQRTVR